VKTSHLMHENDAHHLHIYINIYIIYISIQTFIINDSNDN
jgi:hypothetical protein